MRNYNFIFLVLFTAMFINCSEDDSPTEIVDQNSENISFKLNSKETFENEFSLQIKDDSGQVDFLSTRTLNNQTIDQIKYLNSNGELFIVAANKTSDTLVIYSKNSDGQILEDGFRYITKDAKTDVFEIIKIDAATKKMSIQDHFVLDRNQVYNRNSNTTQKDSEDTVDDLDREIQETGEFLADPSSTHPVASFFKGIVLGIKGGGTDLYNNSAGKLSSISEKLNNKGNNILNNLSKVLDKLKQAKEFIQGSSADFSKPIALIKRRIFYI